MAIEAPETIRRLVLWRLPLSADTADAVSKVASPVSGYTFDLEAALPRVQHPTQVMTGSRDRETLEGSRRAARLFHDGRLHIVAEDDAGESVRLITAAASAFLIKTELAICQPGEYTY